MSWDRFPSATSRSISRNGDLGIAMVNQPNGIMNCQQISHSRGLGFETPQLHNITHKICGRTVPERPWDRFGIGSGSQFLTRGFSVRPVKARKPTKRKAKRLDENGAVPPVCRDAADGGES